MGSVNWMSIGKYVMGAGLFASLFYFAVVGKMPVDQYEGLVYAALAALGVHITQTK